MPLFDSHAHYFDRRFAEVEGGADAILTREVFGAGVSRVINVATGCANAAQCLEQAEKYEGMYAALGIHPEDCRHLEGTPEQEVAKLAELLGVDMRRTIALGDYNNDIGMLRAAGVGIAVANACPEAKAAADRVTVSNEESAIARVISDIEQGSLNI